MPLLKRNIYKNLLDWKSSPNRKPLLLKGARQVGKTYLLEDFGKKEFSKFHVFNFEQDKSLSQVFETDLNPNQILADLSIHKGDRIDSQSDLVIFDEIQACPRALTSLKYFYESMPEQALCCAGSLLGVSLSSESFPVGKVEFQNLFPMKFSEFLEALNEKLLIEVLESYGEVNTISETAHQKLWGCLKEYYMTGGMPQVVSEYIPMRNNRFEAMNNTRKIQKELIEGYYRDFAKHSGKTNSIHIVSVFENVPMQLANSVEGSVSRYRFKGVIPGKKGYADLDGPISWLEKAGLILKGKIVPVEVKSGDRTQAKSLQQYRKKYAPHSAIIISGKALTCDEEKVIKNYPLYLAGSI